MVPAVSPLTVTECAVTSAGPEAVEPYAVVGPYSSRLSDGSSVVQVTVNEVVEPAVAAGPAVIAGAAPSFVRSAAAIVLPPVLVSPWWLNASTA